MRSGIAGTRRKGCRTIGGEGSIRLRRDRRIQLVITSVEFRLPEDCADVPVIGWSTYFSMLQKAVLRNPRNEKWATFLHWKVKGYIEVCAEILSPNSPGATARAVQVELVRRCQHSLQNFDFSKMEHQRREREGHRSEVREAWRYEAPQVTPIQPPRCYSRTKKLGLNQQKIPRGISRITVRQCSGYSFAPLEGGEGRGFDSSLSE